VRLYPQDLGKIADLTMELPAAYSRHFMFGPSVHLELLVWSKCAGIGCKLS